MAGDRPGQPANRNCYALARLMSISAESDFFVFADKSHKTLQE